MIKNKGRSPVKSGARPFWKQQNILYLIIVFIVSALFLYANQLILSINPENGLTKQYFEIDSGARWNIRFQHSVQLTPVEEFFVVHGENDMVLTTTRYQSLGVGLPYSPDEGSFTTTSDGKFLLQMNRKYETVKLRTSIEASQKIIYQDLLYDLCDLYGQGVLVEIKAEKRYRYWLKQIGAERG